MLLEDRDTTLIVRGKVRVIEGYAEVFGCPVVEVSRNGFFPLYLKEGKVEVEGEFIPVKGSTIPESWVKLAEKDFKRIFLVGETDSGKSSLAVWLINSMEKTWVIDADIGQADVAHPGAMGIGVAERVPFLSCVKMLDGFFAGTISPMGRESKCIRGFSSLCRKVEEPVIADTTGWVKGKKAREYKLAKIEAFSPDAVVFLGRDEYGYSDYIECEVVEVESFVPKKRDRETRVEIRNSIYREWFENVEEFEVNSSALRGTTLFRGRTLNDDEVEMLSVFGDVIFAEAGSYFLNVCVEKAEVSSEALKAVKEVFGVEEVNVFEEDWLKGLICGIYANRKYVCPGKIESVDFEEKKLRISAKSMPDRPVIELGEFRISEREEFVRVP